MAELSSRDRLQPSLLDRLIDHHPQDSRENVEARVLSRQQLRAAVLRDLAWLFNAIRAEPEATSGRVEEVRLWRQFSDARRSVLNFGMPAFSGTTLSSMETVTMEAAIKLAITHFEPRIEADSLKVDITIDPQNHHNTLQIGIRGRMWAQPVPLELLLAADVDLETGSTLMRDLRA